MISKVYTIYDEKAASFSQPFHAPTKGIAIRTFTEAASDPASPLSKYPVDFTLYELGEFDSDNAMYQNHLTPLPIGKASDFLPQAN